jgi:predicted RecB family nuclease
MQHIDGQLLLSPTDLTKHLACAHVTTLDLLALGGRRDLGAAAPDDALQLVFRKGMEHESAYLQRLRAAGLSVAEIPTRYDVEGRRQSEAETLAAMREGVDVVYQATFFDGRWGGQADFLLRTSHPSDLGPWSYDIADTKLARRLKVPALLQMATYAERLTVLQGVPPQRLTVVTGDGVERPWRLDDVASYARRARARLQEAVEGAPTTEPAPVSHCSQCRWSAHCTSLWQEADDLSLVAGMRSGHRQALIAAGLPTVEALAAATAFSCPARSGARRGSGSRSRHGCR